MRFAIVVCVLLFFSVSCKAAFTDFSDYAQDQSFAAGEMFQSNSIAFVAHGWGDLGPLPIPHSVSIFTGPNRAALYVGPGVDFILPAGAQEISFLYSAGAGSRIAINGVEPTLYPGQGGVPYQAGFEYLHGTSLAGVAISTVITYNSTGFEEGTLRLSGPIASFSINGLETTIDNVAVRVPEPSAAILLSAGGLITIAVRRWLPARAGGRHWAN